MFTPTAADAVDAFAGKPRDKTRGKRRASIKATLKRSTAEVERRLDVDDWDGLKPTNIVQVWAWCHRETYGVEAGVTAVEWERAVMRAASFAKSEFDGDLDAVLAYVRWAWQRERRYEQGRRDNGKGGGVLGWAKMFGAKVLTDYRIDKARGQG